MGSNGRVMLSPLKSEIFSIKMTAWQNGNAALFVMDMRGISYFAAKYIKRRQ